jgi:hypothetical protein
MYRPLGVLVLVFGLAVSVGVGCGDGDGGSSADCKKTCATVATLKCTSETEASCNTECQQLASIPNCKSQAAALTRCTAARAASDFECVDGESEPKAGVCEAESNAAFACLLGGS